MFLRYKDRWKDGKQHRYWSVVENTRVTGGRVVQRHVLYLGEINDTQELAWRRSIEVLEERAARPRTLTLFPEDRCEGLLADAPIVRVKLSALRLRRPRQSGACWLALMLWRELQLDLFWSKRLGVTRKGTRWDEVLFVLVAYRLLAPGSEWRLHREWFQRSAMADLSCEDAGLAEIQKLYRCQDRLLTHKQAVFRSPGRTVARSVQHRLQRAALRPDGHVLRSGPAVSGRRQAAFWVFARSPARLCADHHRPGGDPRRPAAGL